jgi:hypothetical protein
VSSRDRKPERYSRSQYVDLPKFYLSGSMQRVDWEALWSQEAKKKQLPSLHGALISWHTGKLGSCAKAATHPVGGQLSMEHTMACSWGPACLVMPWFWMVEIESAGWKVHPFSSWGYCLASHGDPWMCPHCCLQGLCPAIPRSQM